jgi:ATP-dependent RNA/DNA helicase IGHMBP2
VVIVDRRLLDSTADRSADFNSSSVGRVWLRPSYSRGRTLECCFSKLASCHQETTPISTTSAENYYDRFYRWLEMDATAEAERMVARREARTRATAEQSGETLVDLAIADTRSGLGGRYLLKLVKRNRTLPLPWNRLRVGAPVLLTPLEGRDDDSSHRGPQNGVVSARKIDWIEVAVEHWPGAKHYDLDLAGDEVTRNRERAALQAVSQAGGRLLQLRKILLGDLDPEFGRARLPAFDEEQTLPKHKHLNDSQQQAVEFALSARDLAIIHGPPGTGKTTTVVEFIRQATARGETVLACAPSNTAVDNLLERLVALSLGTVGDQSVVRLGHPARVKKELQEHTLDALVEAHENSRWIKELMRDAEQLYQKSQRFTRARPERGEKQDLRRQAKQLKWEARTLEKRSIAEVLTSAKVVCSTTTIDDGILDDRYFDWVVIDEACQCTESASWIPMVRGERILLAGDHCQLPPTVISKEAAAEGYARSMMERLVETYGDAITRQLSVQYRMHHQIMSFSSDQFYGDTLVADESVANHTLADLPNVVTLPMDARPEIVPAMTTQPLMFIDTAGADYDEEIEPEGLSKLNPQEGQLVLHKVNELLAVGIDPRDIAVIAPYAAQVRWLRQHASDRALEIDTVDGFQGREKEAVVISLVRSNRIGEIGFLEDKRRTNVALTRARRKLIVVGDSATLGRHAFYGEMLEYFQLHDAYGSVWEEML